MINPLYLSRHYCCGALFCWQYKGNILYPKKRDKNWLVQKLDILRRNYVSSAVEHTTYHQSCVDAIFDHAPTITPASSSQLMHLDIQFFSSQHHWVPPLACLFSMNTICGSTKFEDLIRNNVMSKSWAGGKIDRKFRGVDRAPVCTVLNPSLLLGWEDFRLQRNVRDLFYPKKG